MGRRRVGAYHHAHEVKTLRSVDEGCNDSDEEDEDDQRAAQVCLEGSGIGEGFADDEASSAPGREDTRREADRKDEPEPEQRPCCRDHER